jgi:polyisoprenoid-binding protein YceI
MSETATATTLTGTYNLDPAHSRIGFVARHAMVTKVRGAFSDVVGQGYFDADQPEKSSVELTIQVASVDTGNADRDAHLRANDFFEAEKYPVITYRSTAVQRLDEDHYRVTGDLTIKDVTKPVSVDFELSGPVQDPWGNTRIGLEGRTEILRKDWGVSWNVALEAGGILVSDKVTLEFDVAAVKA